MRVDEQAFMDADARAFIAAQESGQVRSGDEFEDVLIDAMGQSDNWGYVLPWAEKTEERIRLRPGEVSLWAGMSGHLKSAVCQQIIFWQALERTVGIMSFEMTIAQQLKRAVKQCIGTAHPTEDIARKFAKWMKGRVWFYDRLDSVPPERVLGCLLHMAAELGCKIVLIDCLIKVKGISRNAEVEAAFMDQLMAMAKVLDIHVMLVHHIRKPEKGGDKYRPTKHDVRGAGDLVDQCSTLVLVWNDKYRKVLREKQRNHVELNEDEQKYWNKTRDLILDVAKQRNAAFEGRIGFYVSDAMQINDHPVKRMKFELSDIGSRNE